MEFINTIISFINVNLIPNLYLPIYCVILNFKMAYKININMYL